MGRGAGRGAGRMGGAAHAELAARVAELKNRK
jgi:hypothetical protein